MGAYGAIAISICLVIGLPFTLVQVLVVARHFQKPTATPIEMPDDMVWPVYIKRPDTVHMTPFQMNQMLVAKGRNSPTNRDLEKEVAAGRFREDLYYRLSVFPLELPPLRKRTDDIVPLAMCFLKEICAGLGREPLSLTRQQADTLRKHQWPGNIRKLKNVIERSVILTKGSRLRLDLAMTGITPVGVIAKPVETAGADFLTEFEFKQKEKENLIAVLRSANWRVWGPDGAAAMLGIKPSTLTYRMSTFGISKDQH